MNTFHIAIASGLGAGFLRPGPGTWGTLVGALMIYILYLTGMSSPVHLLLLLILVTLLGYVSIARLPKDWEHDDQRIVVDEIAGLLTTLLWIPINLTNVILAFTLFRIYDIFKPFGIRKFDDSKTSWSVLVDDLVAGVYANVTLRLLLIFLAWI